MNSNWDEARKIINDFKFDQEIGRKNLPQSTHKEGTKTHNVENVEILYPDVLGYEFKTYIVFCRICNDTRQKRMVLYNEEGKAFVKDVIRDGHVTNE